MSIGVQSYSELFNTLIAWDQYNNLWGLLNETGLITIPFIVLLTSHIIQAAKSDQGIATLAGVGTQRLLFELTGLCLIMVLAGVPWMKLDSHVLNFTPLCSDTPGKVYYPGNTDTTFDTVYAGKLPSQALVPPVWYASMSLSEGLTRGLKAAMPCYKNNYRQIQTELDTDKISDPLLKKEVGSFIGACYSSAVKKYLGTQNINLPTPLKSEVNSLGSSYFLNTHGYYDSLTSFDIIPNIPVDPMLKQNTCKAWWNTPIHGLHDRLKKEISPGFADYIKSFGNKEEATNKAIDTLVKNSVASPGLPDGMNSLTGALWEGKNYTSRYVGSTLGIAYNRFTFYPKMAVIIQSLPILQSYVLLAIYILLPIIMLITRFNLKTILVLCATIMSIIFWSFWWNLAEVVDRALIDAFFPLSEIGIDGGPQQMLVDMVATLMYIVLPILSTGLLSFAGIPAAGLVSGATGFIASNIGSAGEKAFGAASMVASAAKKYFSK